MGKIRLLLSLTQNSMLVSCEKEQIITGLYDTESVLCINSNILDKNEAKKQEAPFEFL